MAPIETVAQLVPPARDLLYFAHADRFPFNAIAAGPSDVNAWWLADASLLVYGTPEFVEDAFARSPLRGLGYELGWLGPPENVRGMVLSNDDTLILVFRGTRLQVQTILDRAEIVVLNNADFLTDAKLLPGAWKNGGKVHAGFLEAFGPIADHVQSIVDDMSPGQSLWLTGHSLGGALANLAAAYLADRPIRGLYTYGCPRVGNSAFVESLPATTHRRYVHREDWIPRVPPEFLGYIHAGSLEIVSGSPHRRFLEDLAQGAELFTGAIASAISELKLSAGAFPFKISGLADHAPVYYATLLWNAFLLSHQQEGGRSGSGSTPG